MDRPDICKKFLHPKMKILDCGGWQGNNFSYGYIPHTVLDLFPCNDKNIRDWIVGDACNPLTWKNVKDNTFDFSICSHMLEDCYDPFIVMNQLSRVSKAGYIEVPRAWIETTKWIVYKSKNIKGYAHHIWMVDVFTPSELDNVMTINPHITKKGEKYIKNNCNYVLSFYPKMILNHHEILHYNFINPIKSFYYKRKFGKKLDTVSVFWENQIPFTCIWWGSSHKEAKMFWKNYHKNFNYKSLPDYYHLY